MIGQGAPAVGGSRPREGVCSAQQEVVRARRASRLHGRARGEVHVERDGARVRLRLHLYLRREEGRREHGAMRGRIDGAQDEVRGYRMGGSRGVLEGTSNAMLLLLLLLLLLMIMIVVGWHNEWASRHGRERGLRRRRRRRWLDVDLGDIEARAVGSEDA